MKYLILAICGLYCGVQVFAADGPGGHGAQNGRPGHGAQHFTLTGNIRGLKSPFIYLEWAIGESMHKDSAAVKDGKFRITGTVDEPILAYLATKDKYTQFFLENAKIRVRGNIDSLDKLQVSGSSVQPTYDSLRAGLKDIRGGLSKLYGEYSAAHKQKDSVRQQLLEGQIDSLEGLEKEQEKVFIRSHPSSPVSLNAIMGMSYTGDYDLLNGLYSGLDESLKQTRLGLSLGKRVDILRRTAVGRPAMDFTQSDMDGQPVRFSAYNKGRYVLVDFWASWCGPCRAENPNVLKAYLQFKGRNFEILGVSLDDNEAKWKEAVAKDGMPWTEVSDLKGWKNAAAEQYGIQAIPSNFLIDPNGVIVARDLRGEALEKKLAEVLGGAGAAGSTGSGGSMGVGGGSTDVGGQSAGPDGSAGSGADASQPTLDKLRAAVEAHPDSPAVHERYIAAFRKSIPGANFSNMDSVLNLLRVQYDGWIRRFPNVAAVPFAIGHALANAESPAAKPYLLKAVTLDPKLAAAYADLAIDAERWGDFDASDGYYRKAMEAEPANPDYAAYYAFAMERTDFAKYRELSLEVANKFPDSDRGAQMLYWLAFRSANEKEKEATYKLLREKFPPAKFSWSASGMSNYFDLLLDGQPQQALALAREMQPLATDDYSKKEWDADLTMAEKVVEAEKALDEHRAADALTALDAVHPGKYSESKETIALLKARAMDATGNTMVAFDSLAAYYAKEPSDETQAMMMKYAVRLGKSAAWVNNNVQARRLAAAKEAPAFDLYAYQTGRQVSLKDYRGKVVLLTFWFPGCGPCRGEFPHFQEVLGKFKEQGIAYVGINVALSQDPYVLPFMHSSGYSFTPLRDKDQVAEKAYHVRGEPTNFLIDRDGRIIFSNFMIQDPKEQRMLEMMIGSLLAKKA